MRIFDGTSGAIIASFFAYDPGFQQGIYVAAGNVDGDGRADVITGTGVGPPHVKAFDIIDFYNPPLLASFFAYGSSFQGGVRVATAPAWAAALTKSLRRLRSWHRPPAGLQRSRQHRRQLLAYDGFFGGINIAGAG